MSSSKETDIAPARKVKKSPLKYTSGGCSGKRVDNAEYERTPVNPPKI